MENELEIILNPGESSEIIARKPQHIIQIGVVEGEGKIIQLDIRNSKIKSREIEIVIEEDEIVSRIEGDRFQIIASPNSSKKLIVIVSQKGL